MRGWVAVVLGVLSLGACGERRPTEPGAKGSFCIENADCESSLFCANETCTAGPGIMCVPGARRCNENHVEVCGDTGDTWGLTQVCPVDCVGGACSTKCTPNAEFCVDSFRLVRCDPTGTHSYGVRICSGRCELGTCLPANCTPGARRCGEDGSSIFQCTPAGDDDVYVGSCGLGCDNGTCCECAAGTRRCAANGFVDVCEGCHFVKRPCNGECIDGACITCAVTRDSNGAIADREERCDGNRAQLCADSQEEWLTRTTCENGCERLDGQATCR